MNTLYFDDEVPEFISMSASEEISEGGLAAPVPVYARFNARGYPIIGTTVDYFEYRGLRLASGRMLGMIGEVVLGAEVADALGLAPDSSLLSSPESLFDLAGVYPLKMNVVGVLERSHTPDDLAIFADVKTTWIIQGLGHGHQDVARVSDPTLIFERSDSTVSATPKLLHYNEINADNLDSFHFHGDTGVYPLTSVLGFPNDQKSETILRGRYLSDETTLQIVRPTEVIDGLLQNIFRIKSVLDAIIAVVGFATLLAMILVFALSLRLRQREMQTLFKLGCRKGTIARLLGAEIGIILVASFVVGGILLTVLSRFDQDLVRILFIG